jgi:hypothetical protein
MYAPTPRLTSAVNMTDNITAVVLPIKNHGLNATSEPRVNNASEENAAVQGEPSSSGIHPKYLYRIQLSKVFVFSGDFMGC